MLSYMLPGEEKPLGLPPVHPNSLPHDLASQSDATSEDKPSPPESVSTVSSDRPDKPRAKFAALNGTKHAGLKRVSFGSSKGSMVETLVYESPLQEEPEESTALLPLDPDEVDNAEKVRVSFFQSERPLVVSSPEPDFDNPDFCNSDLDPSNMAAAAVQGPPLQDGHPAFHRQGSTDSGWDNPFRPDGDLSREADEIVELIKGGKPITPNSASAGNSFNLQQNGDHVDSSTTQQQASPLLASSPGKSPAKTGINGTTAPTSSLEVQHVRIGAAGDASQVEHVVIKKKPRCKCCVIQ